MKEMLLEIYDLKTIEDSKLSTIIKRIKYDQWFNEQGNLRFINYSLQLGRKSVNEFYHSIKTQTRNLKA